MTHATPKQIIAYYVGIMLYALKVLLPSKYAGVKFAPLLMGNITVDLEKVHAVLCFSPLCAVGPVLSWLRGRLTEGPDNSGRQRDHRHREDSVRGSCSPLSPVQRYVPQTAVICGCSCICVGGWLPAECVTSALVEVKFCRITGLPELNPDACKVSFLWKAVD